jgi:tripartite-type tricarboxylate transporter receptor subunit TctC
MLTRRSLIVASALSGLTVSPPVYPAQGFPTRTVKIVVPFPPGTPSEVVIRTLADRLSSRFGKPFIIENRPGGAGGTLGAMTVATAHPDGYTLLASSPGPLVTAAAIYKDLGYDPAAFVPVALLFNSPQLLAVHPSVPANSLHELIQHARARPGALSFASPGYGTQPHLLGEILKRSAAIDIVHVPYKGPAAALTDLVAGQVQIYFETSPLVLPQAQAAKVRVLAVAGSSRVNYLPEVPTVQEAGFPQLLGGFWSGVVAPAGTPAGIAEAINAAINDAMRSADVRSAIEKLGGSQQPGTPSDFAAFINAETTRWTEIIRVAGLKVN